MVPSLLVELEALPLTPNGKIDRRALVIPGDGQGRADEAVGEARDPIELQLIEIWEEVLDSRPVGVRDNFFDLGGHSLQAVQIIVRMKADMGVRVRPSDLMYQTLRQLAASCGGEPTEEGVAASGGLLKTIRRTLVRD